MKSLAEMSKRQYDLLSFSVLILILGFFSALAVAGIIGLLEIFPLVIAFMGAWLIILTTIQKGEGESPYFSTLSWGLVLIVAGAMGFLYVRNIYGGFFIPALMIVLGLIGIMAVLRSWRKTG